MSFKRIKIAPPPTQKKKKIPQKLRNRILLGSIGSLVVSLAGAACYGIFFSSHFTLEYIDIIGNQGLNMTEVRRTLFEQTEEKKFFIIPESNTLFFDIEKAQNALWHAYALEDVEIIKEYPKTITLTVNEAPFSAIWYTDKHFYKIDSRGNIIKEIAPSFIPFLPKELDLAEDQSAYLQASDDTSLSLLSEQKRQLIIADASNTTPAQKAAISSQALSKMELIQKECEKINIRISYIISKSNGIDIDVVTEEGWKIQINTFESIERQMKNLETVLKEKIGEQRTELEYIDIRFDNRIYYRLR